MTAPILYAADVTPLADPELFQMAYAAASPARREKADHYRFAKSRRLSLGAEALLRHALCCAGDYTGAQLRILDLKDILQREVKP